MTDPVVALLLKTKISPTGLTVVGLVVTLVGAGLVGLDWLVAGAIVGGLGSLFDAFDGSLARARGDANRHGAFVDTMSDRLGELGLFAGVLFHVIDDRLGVALVFFSMSFSMLVPYVRAKAESFGAEGRGGIMGRAERLLVLLVGVGLAGLGLPTLYPSLWILAGLTALTVAMRFYRTWFQLTAD